MKSRLLSPAAGGSCVCPAGAEPGGRRRSSASSPASEHISYLDARRFLKRQKRHKYHAKPAKLDGYSFDSQAERDAYARLKLLERANHVNAIEVHPRLDLHAIGADGIKRKIGAYELDLRFWDMRAKCRRYVDVKGLQTPLSAWKRKHAEAEYGITVELWTRKAMAA